MGNYCHGSYFCGCGSGLVIVGGALVVGGGRVCSELGGGGGGLFAMVMDFIKVMLTSPPELAHCAPPPQSMVDNSK